MNLKKSFLILLLLFGLQTYSQVYRFKTTSLCVATKLLNNKWDKWSKAKEVSLVVTLDASKNRIIVYSEILQLFEILEYVDEVETDKDKTVAFVCRNNDGEICNISIITRKNQGNRMQLYITYNDNILNYNIENLKE